MKNSRMKFICNGRWCRNVIVGVALVTCFVPTQIVFANEDAYVQSQRYAYEKMRNKYNLIQVKKDIVMIRDMILDRFRPDNGLNIRGFDGPEVAENCLGRDQAKKDALDKISFKVYNIMKGYTSSNFDFDDEFALLNSVVTNGDESVGDYGIFDLVENFPVSSEAACRIGLAYHVALKNNATRHLLDNLRNIVSYEFSSSQISRPRRNSNRNNIAPYGKEKKSFEEGSFSRDNFSLTGSRSRARSNFDGRNDQWYYQKKKNGSSAWKIAAIAGGVALFGGLGYLCATTPEKRREHRDSLFGKSDD